MKTLAITAAVALLPAAFATMPATAQDITKHVTSTAELAPFSPESHGETPTDPPTPAVPAPHKYVNIMSLDVFKKATANLTRPEKFETAAIVNIDLQQYTDAIGELEVLVKNTPVARSQPYYLLALAYNRVGDPTQALAAANIAITLEPYRSFYYYERGLAEFGTHDNKAALADFDTYLKPYRRTAANGYYFRGLTEVRLKYYTAARRDLNKAKQINQNLAVLTDHYLALLDARDGKYAQAGSGLKDELTAFDGAVSPWQQRIQAQQTETAALAAGGPNGLTALAAELAKSDTASDSAAPTPVPAP